MSFEVFAPPLENLRIFFKDHPKDGDFGGPPSENPHFKGFSAKTLKTPDPQQPPRKLARLEQNPDHPQQSNRELARTEPTQNPAAQRDTATATATVREKGRPKKASGPLAHCIGNQARDSLLARITASTEKETAAAHPYRQDKTKLFE
ncbi:hypothetical protein PTTG_29354 [Puccinia triticina 1-1 BBBD Race 1]|uniref:Uncharacterized protein n=1 Tax=Puccinia triticina (isolate 1-1 / race 1 (BBBD)) TaxID=630390 RepID=A0A180G5C5_PUCT1|nr:hypothetical protein PTTG_29354 [Puccinia triticina 1-1 BBBD Race 1]